MKSLLLLSLLLISTSFALNSPSNCTFSYVVIQTARETWNNGVNEFTLYDLSLTNTGSVAFPPLFIIAVQSTDDFAITQGWNLIEYGWTDPKIHPISVDPDVPAIEPGQTWTGSGYVATSQTILVLFQDSCPSGPSTSTSSASSTSTSSSSTTGVSATTSSSPTTGSVSATTSSSPTTSSSSTSTTGSSSACTLSIAQTKTNNWESNGVIFTQFIATVTNTGSLPINQMQLSAGSLFSSISETYSVILSGQLFTFPTWILQSSLQVAANFQFGYTIQGQSNPVNFVVNTIC